MRQFVQDLAKEHHPGLFNPWADTCRMDLHQDAPQQRQIRLLQHLENPDAKYLLIGEALSARGGRYTGIPFSSEKLLYDGAIPRVTGTLGNRITRNEHLLTEISATIVWKTLFALGIAEQTVLWNAVPWHPEDPDNPFRNRTPTYDERQIGLPYCQRVIDAFPGCSILAVGDIAEKTLKKIGVPHIRLRHPSHGGANIFRLGLHRVVNNN